jgi:hypothetical protein
MNLHPYGHYYIRSTCQWSVIMTSLDTNCKDVVRSLFFATKIKRRAVQKLNHTFPSLYFLLFIDRYSLDRLIVLVQGVIMTSLDTNCKDVVRSLFFATKIKNQGCSETEAHISQFVFPVIYRYSLDLLIAR